MSVLLILVALVGCTPPAGQACSSGIRESFGGTVTTPDGTVELSSSQCIQTGWSPLACDDTAGPEACSYLFGPQVDPKVPLDVIHNAFVGMHAFGHLESSPKPEFTGMTDFEATFEAYQQNKLDAGYQVGPVQPTTLLGDHPAWGLTISCDHPDVDVLCPYTWDYFLVDLSAIEPGLYGDFSAIYSGYIQAGNAAAERPEEFAAYKEMMRTAELEQ